MTDTQHDGSGDFDFWMGRWDVRNERLKGRLCGATEWETFPAVCEARLLAGGLGNTDHFIAEDWRPGFVGLTVRLFDRAKQQWSIYWADNAHGVFDPPVTGRFVDGVGTFDGVDQHEGTTVRVRFTWTHDTPTTARWQQAFSADDGATWETNWIMHMSRAD
ncbi:MAG: hypothetical protein QOH21_642 [Acidobacteriota bacterium]|jgi:hypothetical protein|nr:hypothetical protein [Acidobacteriota bacterium]